MNEEFIPETVGEIIEGKKAVIKEFLEVDGPLEMPIIKNQELWDVGIYFDVPEHVYHEIPALSCSGIRNLLASPTKFWAESWLNPDKDRKDEDHFIVGHAYHAMILEGDVEYKKRFFVPPNKADYPKALHTATEIKAAIKAANGKPVTKVKDEDNPEIERAAKKEDWVEQLVKLDRSVQVWDAIIAKAELKAGDRKFISSDDDKRIRVAARMIAQDPQLQKAVRNGWPEVTLIWHDPRQGVLMKARCDYLKFKAIVDLKSFNNRNNLSVRNAIVRFIAEYRSFLQPAVYMQGVDEVRKLIRKNGASVINYYGKEKGSVEASDAEAWAMKWASYNGADRWLWIFQQKGDAPITRGYWHPIASTVHALSQSMVVDACRTFREMSEIYQTDPWLDLAEIDEIHDDEIPVWGLEI